MFDIINAARLVAHPRVPPRRCSLPSLDSEQRVCNRQALSGWMCRSHFDKLRYQQRKAWRLWWT